MKVFVSTQFFKVLNNFEKSKTLKQETENKKIKCTLISFRII